MHPSVHLILCGYSSLRARMVLPFQFATFYLGWLPIMPCASSFGVLSPVGAHGVFVCGGDG